MRLRNITLAGMILIVLAFTIGMAGAIENGTGNETPSVNVTGNSTETLTVNVTETPTVNVTGTPTETLTVTPEVDDNETNDNELDDKDLIGPGHLLYRLKIAFENMGETFTYNSSEKLGKQVSHARHRINEYRKALKQNDMKAADKALAQYEEKMNEVNASMSKLSGNDTGLINAQQMILKHQFILENLSISHPDNKGLQRAYKNSKNLQTKFASKIEKKFDANSTKKNQEINSTKENREIRKAEKTEVSIKDTKSEKGSKRSN
ncbi:Uncharacterised protein [uncultured archaeon]|nr:Uncharacterised protein [uncultured archaeon]